MSVRGPRPRVGRALGGLLVAAAVAGATGGTVVARAALDRPGPVGPVGPAGPGPGAATYAPDQRVAEPLWATPDQVRDGDRTVRVDLPAPPVALQRAADGWVVSTATDPDERVRRTWVVTPGGDLRRLATTVGSGDVGPDGRHYVAQAGDGSGYAVWDLATGEQVASVPAPPGSTPARLGGAQLVDVDTVAATWSRAGVGDEVVVLTDLGSGEHEVLADDVHGRWAVSSDGRWFAGTLAELSDGVAESGCVVVRPVDGSGAGRTDCGGRFPGPVSFAADSSAVLTVPVVGPDLADVGPDRFRPVPTGDCAVPDRVRAPVGTDEAVMLGPGQVVSVGVIGYELGVGSTVGEMLADSLGVAPDPRDPSPRTLVARCAAGAGCTTVARTRRDHTEVVLGTSY